MLRLGLDLGTNSIGWALLRLSDDAPHEPIQLVDGGVLIHPDGRNPKNKASNAATRREKRGPRRNRDRMIMRRRRVADLLHNLDLLPETDEARSAIRNLDPFRLRAEGLDRPLAPHELGRVLLSFANRRGFKSNRKAGNTGDDGKIRQDTNELRRRMAQAGARTLGDYLWRRRSQGKTIRARLGNGLYPDREMVQQELECIREAQAADHENMAGEDWDEIVDTLLYQRELRPVDRGRCVLMPCEPRAYKAYPLFQEFRIRQEVRNLEVAAVAGEPFRALAAADRERIVARLMGYKYGEFDKIFPEGVRVNLATVARDRLDGDKTAATLRKRTCFGRAWDELGVERQQEIVERLMDMEDHGELIAWLRAECGLDDQAAEMTASASLPLGTAHLSKAAIERLLPHMREGLRYHEAVEAAGLGSHSDLRGDGKARRLPYYGEVLKREVIGGRTDARNDVERFGRIANPTVHIALGQMRRLFNAIADRFGKPDEVVVELARDLKQSRVERERDEKLNARNRERNERLRVLAADCGFENPSSRDMRKLRLWDEQGPPDARVCPFTGEVLSIGKVLSEQTEIEHILPYSKSLDDSMANTVLSMRTANRQKGQRTPYEAWGHDSGRYQQIRAWAAMLPPNKQWRFEENAMERLDERGGFLARHLNDTRYLSRVTRLYLQAAVHPDRVGVTPGRLTSMLRHAWGLNSLLSDTDQKERSDHRHHLIDAIVVGMTSRSLLQKVAKDSAMAVDDLGGRVAKVVADPWKDFRNDVKDLVDRVVVRHRPDHFTAPKQGLQRTGHDVTTGALHNDTAYGIVSGPDADGWVTLVESKPLDGLEPNRLKDVRDHTLREHLCDLWNGLDATDGKPAERRREFAKQARECLGVRRVRVLTKLHRDSLAFIRDGADRVYKAYKTDGNAFMDIWLLPNSKVVGETVSRFNAHQSDFRPQVKCEYPTARKLMRLHINDTIAIGEGDDRRILRIQKLSRNTIVAVDHWRGGKAKETPVVNKQASRVLKDGLRRVSVDILGGIRDGGPHKGTRAR